MDLVFLSDFGLVLHSDFWTGFSFGLWTFGRFNTGIRFGFSDVGPGFSKGRGSGFSFGFLDWFFFWTLDWFFVRTLDWFSFGFSDLVFLSDFGYFDLVCLTTQISKYYLLCFHFAAPYSLNSLVNLFASRNIPLHLAYPYPHFVNSKSLTGMCIKKPADTRREILFVI
jgi:hypothetical protein